jgi:hypothetical protein
VAVATGSTNAGVLTRAAAGEDIDGSALVADARVSRKRL